MGRQQISLPSNLQQMNKQQINRQQIDMQSTSQPSISQQSKNIQAPNLQQMNMQIYSKMVYKGPTIQRAKRFKKPKMPAPGEPARQTITGKPVQKQKLIIRDGNPIWDTGNAPFFHPYMVL